ncbi:selenoneine biosynthesis selenosugar synthase SenB [Pelomicrobium methylotrophicum]|uniref:selenoneine biosynthesis selenosugar synthase SenB n=1 Tax=Pelomicrobium methylotrophicum TaxID=2602750 RepID=UPI001969DE90|nr:selenoneine biosynthesis selenosugar synthase SenB [Pelomicrobium methylotrophicum]
MSSKFNPALSSLRIAIVTPSAVTRRTGNRHTAARWRRFLREAGHDARVHGRWDGKPVDLLLALHARKSYEAIRAFRDAFPDRPLVLALTGTDLYRDIRVDSKAQEALRLATRLIVLQDRGADELAPELQGKVHVVYQSAPPLTVRQRLPGRAVCVIGHLREEKDPFRAALALSHIPPTAPIHVVQLGAALAPEFARRARALMDREPRYRWIGELPRPKARRTLAASWLMVVSSHMEGGANVIAEAVMSGVPVLASRVPGNVGMLGEDYPGYFPVGDEKALAALLTRADTDPTFYEALRAACAARQPLFLPEREMGALLAAVSSAADPALPPPH